jgi:hypothetical protein
MRTHGPDAIQEDFPSLKRAQVRGATAFYLDHQAEIDKHVEETDCEFERQAFRFRSQPFVLRADLSRRFRGRSRRSGSSRTRGVSPGLLIVAQRTSIGAAAEAIVTLWGGRQARGNDESGLPPAVAYQSQLRALSEIV